MVCRTPSANGTNESRFISGITEPCLNQRCRVSASWMTEGYQPVASVSADGVETISPRESGLAFERLEDPSERPDSLTHRRAVGIQTLVQCGQKFAIIKPSRASLSAFQHIEKRRGGALVDMVVVPQTRRRTRSPSLKCPSQPTDRGSEARPL